MKSVLLSLVFFTVGAGGVYFYNQSLHSQPSPSHSDCDDCDHHGDWCNEHEIAESECPFCNRGLIVSRGMCEEHRVPEALCTRCNPALVPAFKAEKDWCAEHAVPESQCELCNPGLFPTRDVRPTESDARPGVQNGRPGVAVVEAAPDPVGFVPRALMPPTARCAREFMQIRLASADIADDLGLVVEAIRAATAPYTFTCPAQLSYDAHHYARVTPRLAGILTEVRKDLGEAVAAGETLAVLDCLELGLAKSAYLEALALLSPAERNQQREQELAQKGLTTEESLLAAEARLVECRVALGRAEETLRNYGLSRREIEALGRSGDRGSLLPLVAPLSGLVVERDAVVGERVETDRSLFAVADTTTLWAMLSAPESELGVLALGLPVLLEVNGLPGERFAGTLDWISTALDARTRTLSARARIENPHGLLRAGMFGRGTVAVGQSRPSTLVPKAAVQWEGCCNVAFVRADPTVFRPRKLALAYESGDYFVVRSGLEPGEAVVTEGSFLLKTELLKESIGAGCCESVAGL